MQADVGMLGGVFDPIHYGHLWAAEAVAEKLDLETVLFVPVGTPPHKPAFGVTSAAHRVEMIRIAIAGNPRFRLHMAEIERPGASYTVDTVQELLSVGRRPLLILGVDAFLLIRTWHRWSDLLGLAPVALVGRPGYDVRDALALAGELGATVACAEETAGVAVSGTDLRERLVAGRSVKYLVPDRVAEYIRSNRLYVP
jgi:nicotinate-nucleotide adenylyltransferase